MGSVEENKSLHKDWQLIL